VTRLHFLCWYYDTTNDQRHEKGKTTNERYPVERGSAVYLQRDEIAAVGEHLFEYLLFPVFVFEVARGTVVEEFGHGVFLGQHVVAQHSHRVCARQEERRAVIDEQGVRQGKAKRLHKARCAYRGRW